MIRILLKTVRSRNIGVTSFKFVNDFQYRHVSKSSCLLYNKSSNVEVQKTSIRYPNIKRGNFSVLNDDDISVFRMILSEPGEILLAKEGDDLSPYNTDWLKSVSGNSEIVLRPRTTEQISKIMLHCNNRKLAVSVQGGNTGLVGGSVPVFDEIILSTERMNKIIDFDSVTGVLQCQAGCILERLEDFVNEQKYIMPFDLGAKGSCQIGGNISTNAGGIRLIRYGSLHGSVLGLEAVLPNGEIIDCLSTFRKDNTGYDLKQLFIGSEGNLGIVTKVSILCARKPNNINVALLGLTKYEQVLEILKLAKDDLGEILSAFEYMDRLSMDTVTKNLGQTSPIGSHPFYCLIETSGSNARHDEEKLNEFLETCLNTNLADDGVFATEPSKIKTIWKLREDVATAVASDKSQYAIPYDFSLNVKDFNTFVNKVQEKCSSLATVMGFGHAGDGNLHLFIQMDYSNSKEVYNILEPYIFKLVKEQNGSISAEHGMGLQKNKWITLSKSEPSAIWNLRESIASACKHDGYTYKYDLSIPITQFQTLVENVKQRLDELKLNYLHCIGYGHVGDGNIHLNIVSKTFDKSIKSALEPFIFEQVQNYKGSVSAEHGLGFHKNECIKFSKSSQAISLMGNIKFFFDPKSILNPYKTLKSTVD